jgi:hypothetical protein
MELIIYAYLIAVGFVLAGVLSSFVQLVSGQPMRFGVEPNSTLTLILGVLWVFAVPRSSCAMPGGAC